MATTSMAELPNVSAQKYLGGVKNASVWNPSPELLIQ